MSAAPTVADVIARLSPGQRSAILGMDEVPAVLGCSEPSAIGLSKPTTKRPALAYSVPGKPWRKFALTPNGMDIRAAMEATS